MSDLLERLRARRADLASRVRVRRARGQPDAWAKRELARVTTAALRAEVRGARK